MPVVVRARASVWTAGACACPVLPRANLLRAQPHATGTRETSKADWDRQRAQRAEAESAGGTVGHRTTTARSDSSETQTTRDAHARDTTNKRTALTDATRRGCPARPSQALTNMRNARSMVSMEQQRSSVNQSRRSRTVDSICRSVHRVSCHLDVRRSTSRRACTTHESNDSNVKYAETKVIPSATAGSAVIAANPIAVRILSARHGRAPIIRWPAANTAPCFAACALESCSARTAFGKSKTRGQPVCARQQSEDRWIDWRETREQQRVQGALKWNSARTVEAQQGVHTVCVSACCSGSESDR